MEEKPEIVIELSQEGYDVETAGDENLLFSSQWPSVKYGREVTFSIPNQNNAATYDHDWGEATAFFAYVVGASASEPSAFPQLAITDTQLKWAGGTGITSALELKVFITDIKLEQNYLAPMYNVGAEPSAINRDYLVALSKEGYDVESEDLRNFVFHSYCRSPMLHQVVHGTTAAVASGPGVNGVDAVHGLSYRPMHFVYKKTAAGWVQVVGVGGTEGAFVMSDRIRYGNTASGVEASVIVWKDPFTLTSIANVTQ